MAPRRLLPALAVFWLLPVCVLAERLPLDRIELPPGFSIAVYAEVPEARSLVLGPNGIVFVGSMRRGTVSALVPRPDGSAETVVLAKGLSAPNGVAFRDGALYVAEVGRILRYDGIEARLRNPP